MKGSNDITENQTRNLPACSAVPQPTVARHTNKQKKTNKDTPAWLFSRNFCPSVGIINENILLVHLTINGVTHSPPVSPCSIGNFSDRAVMHIA
jgi:hypothetical protein